MYWPIDATFYPGTVSELTDNGSHVISYDDGDTESLIMSDETWRFQSSLANASTISSMPTICSNEQEILSKILDTFGNKPFLLRKAQAFDQHVIRNVYLQEESGFLKTVSVVPRSSVQKR